MLKRLEEKKIVRNNNSVVEALIKKKRIFMENRVKYLLKKILMVLYLDF